MAPGHGTCDLFDLSGCGTGIAGRVRGDASARTKGQASKCEGHPLPDLRSTLVHQPRYKIHRYALSLIALPIAACALAQPPMDEVACYSFTGDATDAFLVIGSSRRDLDVPLNEDGSTERSDPGPPIYSPTMPVHAIDTELATVERVEADLIHIRVRPGAKLTVNGFAEILAARKALAEDKPAGVIASCRTISISSSPS